MSPTPNFETVLNAAYLFLSQTFKAIMNSQHVVPLDDADPDSWAHSCVHASAGGTHIQNSHINVTLMKKKVWK